MEATVLVLGAPVLMGHVHPSQNTDAGSLRLPFNQPVKLPQTGNTLFWYILDWGAIIFWMIFSQRQRHGPLSPMTLNCC